MEYIKRVQQPQIPQSPLDWRLVKMVVLVIKHQVLVVRDAVAIFFKRENKIKENYTVTIYIKKKI